MKKTTAPGSSGGLYVDDNPSLGVVGTLLIAEDRNAVQAELVAPIEGAGIVLDGADNGQLWKALRKIVKERGREVGEIFSLLDRKAPVGWSGAAADTYFPALCLTDIASYTDIAEANAPDAVPYLRAKKLIFKDGVSGEIASPGVTAWAIATNVATLTFTNDADHIAFLTALLEDKLAHGGYSNWRTVTLANAIGNITAGTYAITDVNASSRTISFAFTAANASGAVTATVDFYAHRIPGSTTTARVFSARGLTIHGANDDNGYFVSGGLRRRGFMQQITGTLGSARNIFRESTTTGAFSTTNPSNSGTDAGSVVNNYEFAHFDSANSPGARTSKETHGPALTVHLYMHLGRYVA
jgi:hypothetical protein